MIGIYKITNPSGKIYIGQTVNIEKRFKEYKNIHVTIKQQIKIYNSLKKYGSENHIFEIIEECLLEQLDEREIYWGVYYKTLESEFGLNLRLGKGRGLVSQETKDRIGDKNKKPKPKGFGEIISLLKKGKPNLLNRGKFRSQETKELMSQNIKGKKTKCKTDILNLELIKEQYKTLSTNQLAKINNLSIPTMLGYLKDNKIYKFRNNYMK